MSSEKPIQKDQPPATQQQYPSNEINLMELLQGADTRTTIMLKNIPNKFNQQTVLDLINKCHEGRYDYFYLPMDLKTQCNVGYAFINFAHPLFILDFFSQF